MSETLIAILLAVALDRFLPDRQGIKPFAWYRDWAESIEERFNGGKRVHGIGAVLLATLPLLLGMLLVRYILGELSGVLRFAFDVFVLYLCLDIYRLGRNASAVSEAIEAGNLPEANEHLKELSGKSAPEQTEAAIARATVETVLKQGNSFVISPLFWFFLFGPFGAVLQRLSCILDMLWGHRYERFAEFGWAAARFDDLLGWIPGASRHCRTRSWAVSKTHCTAGAGAWACGPTSTADRCWPRASVPCTCRLARRCRKRANTRSSRPSSAWCRTPATCAGSWRWCGACCCCGWSSSC